ncbi:Heat shock transcription factor [Malassezia sp. CBS 17886]|nr:Heat shock transcription factor [Malassezia sp. CBS 17886]
MASYSAPSAEAGHARTGSGTATPTVMNRSNPAFLNKLRSMVDDSNTDELIRWSPSGETFLVPHHVRFGDEVLPRFFKHNNFSSFVRQLNMYGFHKVPHLQQGALKHDQPTQNELWEFSNPCFHRDQPELLSKVQRKRSGKERENAATLPGGSCDDAARAAHANAMGLLTQGEYDSVLGDMDATDKVGPMQLASVLSAIQSIKGNQRTIIEELSQLQHSSQALWQQGMENRQQTRRQQDTINRILRFLASVFGSSNVGDMLHNPPGAAKPPGSVQDDERTNARATSEQVHESAQRSPRRSQKRARLLIGDANQALLDKDMSDLAVRKTGAAHGPFHSSRFTETAGSDADGSTPSSRWTSRSNSTLPGSPASPTHEHLAPVTPGANLQSDAWPSNPALQHADQNAWLSSLLASQSGQSTAMGGLRIDPHILQTLQGVLTNAQDDEGVGTVGTGEESAANATTGTQGAQPWLHMPWSRTDGTSAGQTAALQALIPSILSPRRPDGNAADTASSSEHFAADVRRIADQAHANMEDTTKLQNNIDGLVQHMRLDPTQAHYLASAPASTPPLPATAPAPAGSIPADAAKWDTNMASLVSPSSYEGSSPMPTAAAPAFADVPPTAGDFDLDSFLNQFVDPTSTSSPATQSIALAGHAPAAGAEDAHLGDANAKDATKSGTAVAAPSPTVAAPP